MTVLVTGGAGYIGSHAVLALLDQGYKVVVVDNLSTGDRRLVPPECVFIEGNVGDEKLLVDLYSQYSFEAVMHFAASSIVSESVNIPLKYYLNNTCHTATLLNFLSRLAVKPIFIFSSTASVYGIPKVIPMNETDVLEPISPYGHSKLMAEKIIQDTAESTGINYGILRYFNVAGADSRMRAGQISKQSTHLIKIAAEYAVGLHPEIKIFGEDYATPDGTCIRDYIHVSDLAEFHVILMQHLRDKQLSGIWNIGYGKGFSVKEVLASVEKNIGRKLALSLSSRREGDPPILISSIQKLKKDFDWIPQYNDLDFIIQSAIAWEKKLGGERKK